MRWRAFVWIVRIALVGSILYGLWCGTAYYAARHYFRQGMVYSASDAAKATRSFRVAVRLQPRNGRYRAALGRAAMKSGQFGLAVENLRVAAERRPQDFGVWHDLGDAYLRAGAPGSAAEAFRRALEIRPEAPLALQGLAEAAVRAGDSGAALDPLRRLWQRTPSDLDLGARLARALLQQGKHDEALKVCSQAKQQIIRSLAGKPQASWRAAAPFLAVEGDVQQAKGRWPAAIASYLTCLSSDPRNEAAIAGLQAAPDEIVRPVAVSGRPSAPAFARKGTKLAFCWRDHEGESGLYVLDGPAAEPRKVSGEVAAAPHDAPAWSPDGAAICYAGQDGLRVVSADGRIDHALVRQPAALPQLEKLGMASRPETTATRFRQQRAPAWSPDGKRIAYWAWDAEDGSLTCVVDVATGRVSSVHATKGAPPKLGAQHGPVWCPDGRLLCGPLWYAKAKPAPKPGLTIWSSEGVVQRQIPIPLGSKADPSVTPDLWVAWAPDAQHLAIAVCRGHSESRVAASLTLVHATGKRSWVAARDVAVSAHDPRTSGRWLDSKRLWFLRRTGDHPLEAGVTAAIADTQGNVSPAKETFSVVPMGEWDLSADRTLLAMASPALAGSEDGSGLWLFNLQRLRPSKR